MCFGENFVLIALQQVQNETKLESITTAANYAKDSYFYNKQVQLFLLMSLSSNKGKCSWELWVEQLKAL